MAMKDEQNSTGVNKVAAKKFSQMSLVEKIRHVGKVIVFVLTFGFAFPSIFSD